MGQEPQGLSIEEWPYFIPLSDEEVAILRETGDLRKALFPIPPEIEKLYWGEA